MKYLWIALIAIVLTAGLAAIVYLQPANNSQTVADTNQSQSDTDSQAESQDEQTDNDIESPSSQASPGRYQDYDSNDVAADGYNETILFFHAAWCPECRAFEMAISDEGVPDGIQILKVDYDDSDELKAKHGVTLQSTFVKVNDDGEQLSKWVGYSQDKSVDAILENT